MSFLPSRPSPALVVAVIALVVALGGTSYAAITSVPRHSVGTRQLRNGAVTAAKLKRSAVRTAKLKNGAVTTAKLKNGAVTTVKLKNGAVTAAKLNTAGVTVPNAIHAQTASTATTASTAATAGTARTAETATKADSLATSTSGSTESGSFAPSMATEVASQTLWTAISFPQPLAEPLSGSSKVVVTTSSTADCPGVGQAAAGYLCLYVAGDSGLSATTPSGVYVDSPSGAGKYGVSLSWETNLVATTAYIYGSWTVSAP